MEGAVEEFDDAGLLAEFDEWVADHVRAQHREQFVGLACQVKRVGELERVLEIHVVVGEAVDEEERARELRGVGGDVAHAIGFRGKLRETEVALRVVRVVVFPGDDGGPGDGGLENIGTANGGHGGEVATKGPAGDAHAAQVEFRQGLRERAEAGDLICEGDVD